VKKQIKKLALTVAFLDKKSQVAFIRQYLNKIKDDKPLLEYTCVEAGRLYCHSHPDTGNNIEHWMEGRLEKDPAITPKRLAYECRYYKRLKREMTPYLTSLARRVKDRVLVRRKRRDSNETFSDTYKIEKITEY
jgi:hypothetical protein